MRNAYRQEKVIKSENGKEVIIWHAILVRILPR